MSPELRYAILAVVSIGLLAAALWGMLRGWRRRAAARVPAPSGPLGGPAISSWRDVLYVATSLRGEPLERVAIRPLGYRGRADIVLREDGADIAIRGEEPFGIPARMMRGVARGTATIDRVVERGGLTVLFWATGPEDAPVELESAFRIVDERERERLIASLETLIKAAARGPAAEQDHTREETR